MLRSRLVRTTVVLALVVIPLSLFTGRGLAVVGPEYRVLFGPIGVGAGQGARVNVYAIGNPNDLPWEFAVRIFNTRGELVQQRETSVGYGPASFEAPQFGFFRQRSDRAIAEVAAQQINFLQLIAKSEAGDAGVSNICLPKHLEHTQLAQLSQRFQGAVRDSAAHDQLSQLRHMSEMLQPFVRQPFRAVEIERCDLIQLRDDAQIVVADKTRRVNTRKS